MTPVIRVATAVIFGEGVHRGLCLYGRRPANVRRPSMWEHPGGKLEAGETVHVAAKRECQEELGVEIDVLGDLTTVSFDLVDSVILLHGVAARIAKGEPKPLASQELRWHHPQYAVDHLPCTPGTYLLHRAIMAWRPKKL